ncbi:MAG: hypothetical protein LBE61_03325 [Burkholderiaceae bacterium]|nr:hypothetical protein [Burkholderiaceae bacterium]
MPNSFSVLESKKIGLESKESYVVVRCQTAFLRILGNEPKWKLMTATADEDHGLILVCADRRRLVEAALRLGLELNTRPTVENDWKGREYVLIAAITRESGESDEAFNKENDRVLRRFFEIFDGLPKLSERTIVERQNLYEELAVGDHGEEIYLSDGVWLSNDGSLNDRGR